MDGLDDRRRASEERFIRGEERRVRLRRRRDRHLAHAVAARMGLTPAEADAYADGILAWKPAGTLGRDEALVQKVVADLSERGLTSNAAEVGAMLREAQAASDRDESA